MLHIVVCLQYTAVGLAVFVLTFLITAHPDFETMMATIQFGSMVWVACFGGATVLLLWMYWRNPHRRFFTVRWPAWVAEAIWLLLAGVLTVGTFV